MYRPDGWENVDIHDTLGDAWLSDYTYREIFEAGADAILETLKKKGKKLSNTDLDVYGRLLSAPEHYPEGGEDEYKGYLVFIPDKS